MSLFVCGTDTGVGKTVVSAALLKSYAHLPALKYWKPVQTGTDEPDGDDRRTVQELTGLPEDRFLANTFRFAAPLSPHRAAELEDAEVEVERVAADLYGYRQTHTLLVEGAGGLLVPLTRRITWLDFLREHRLPVLLATRSTLGTINHSLLTIRALREAGIEIAGLIFCGPDNADNERTVCEMGGVRRIDAFDWKPGDPLPELDAAGVLREYLA